MTEGVFNPGGTCVKRTGVPVVPLVVTKVVWIPVMMYSLRKSTAEAFVLPSRVLS